MADTEEAWFDRLLNDDIDDDSEYFRVLNRFLRHDERKSSKRRQGRSYKSRERAKETRRAHVGIRYEQFPVCECGNLQFYEDRSTGDNVCSECGIVITEKGLGFSEHEPIRQKYSKPYRPLVHFRQRLAQLTGKDPQIRSRVFNTLTRHLRSSVPVDEMEKIGKRRVSRALTQLKLPRRYSANWIQVRRRMNLDPEPPVLTNEDFLWKRMNQRYWCLTEAFNETLSKKTHAQRETLPPTSLKSLSRKNIINVNYSFLQLLRLEDPSMLEVFGKFFPQLCSKEQPNKNNKRWKVLMEYCKKNFRQSVCPKTEEIFVMNWEFLPLTQTDIEKYCVYFD